MALVIVLALKTHSPGSLLALLSFLVALTLMAGYRVGPSRFVPAQKLEVGLVLHALCVS